MSETITPRLLRSIEAARYLSISEALFHARVADAVVSIRIGSRRVWDRHQLDQWIDRQQGLLSATSSPADRNPLDELLGT